MRLATALFLALLSDLPLREIMVGESVEWMVYDTDLIVTGTITESAISHVPNDSSTTWEVATLQVSDVLKGEKRESVKFILRSWPEGPSPAKWKETKTDVLLFLVTSDRYAADQPRYREAPYVPRLSSGMPRVAVFTLDGKAPIGLFDVKFGEHLSKDGLLRATKQAVTDMDKVPPKEVRVPVPEESGAYRRLYAGSAVFLVIPVDGAMEKRAVEKLGSSDIGPRVDAIETLSNFPGEKNIVRLKALLKDSSHLILSDGNGRNRRKVFAVRRAAYQVLKRWNVDVAEPVTEE